LTSGCTTQRQHCCITTGSFDTCNHSQHTHQQLCKQSPLEGANMEPPVQQCSIPWVLLNLRTL
jgi:hypothetical protein